MTKTTEEIRIVLLNCIGSTDSVPTMRTGVVYKKRDGREWAHYKKGYHLVTRDANGGATIAVSPTPTQPAPAQPTATA